jgi:hypothetical protein
MTVRERKQQADDVGAALERAGWRVVDREQPFEDEWWASEIWTLESTCYPDRRVLPKQAGQQKHPFGGGGVTHMAGLHFSCGKLLGEDKSADPLFDIIGKELGRFVTEEEQSAWCDQFLVPFNRQSRAQQLKLKPEMMRAIAEPLRRFRDALVQRLGLSGPEASLEELGAYPRVESAEERKLICVRDLLAGNEVCQRTGKPIVVVFA